MDSWPIREVRSWILRWVFVSASHCRSRDDQVRLDGHDGSALDATRRASHLAFTAFPSSSDAIMGRAGYRRARNPNVLEPESGRCTGALYAIAGAGLLALAGALVFVAFACEECQACEQFEMRTFAKPENEEAVLQ